MTGGEVGLSSVTTSLAKKRVLGKNMTRPTGAGGFPTAENGLVNRRRVRLVRHTEMPFLRLSRATLA